MGIQYFEDEKIFKLDTKNTSYIIALVDEEPFVGHAYSRAKTTVTAGHLMMHFRLNTRHMAWGITARAA